MKKQLMIFVTIALMLTALFGLGSTAMAAGENLDVSSDVTELMEGATVDFSATITAGDTALTNYKIMCGSTTCYDSGGATLLAGDTAPVDFSFAVTTEMLGNPINFVLVADEGSNLAADSVTIAKKAPTILLAVTQSVTEKLVDAGDTTTFSFAFENQGDVDIDNIVISAPELNGGKPLSEGFTLVPTQSHTVRFKHTMVAGITVNPVVKYSSGGVAQTPIVLDPTTLTLASRYVDPQLTVSNAFPNPDEEVTFTLTIPNQGNVSYTNMKVTLDGEEMDFPTTRLNPGDSPSQTYKMSFSVSTEVKFNVALKDHTGELVSVDSNTVSIQLPVDPEDLQSKLVLALSVDRPKLTAEGVINFEGYISNASEYTLTSVSVDEPTLGNIFATPTLEGGGREQLSFPVDINETTTYEFVLTAKDRDGKLYTVNAEPITVTISSVPVPSDELDAAVIATPVPSIGTGDSGGSNNFGTLLIVFIVLAVLIVGVGVALLVLWQRGRKPVKTTAVKKSKASTAKKRPTASRAPSRGKTSKTYRDRNNF